MADTLATPVVVVDVNMRFGSMVRFMVLWAIRVDSRFPHSPCPDGSCLGIGHWRVDVLPVIDHPANCLGDPYRADREEVGLR
jgi:hypothetical protein